MGVEFKGGLSESKKSMLRAPPGLVALIDSGVAGLSATAGVDESRAVTVGTPEMPSREAVESHHFTPIPFCLFVSCMHFWTGPRSSTLPPRWR